MDKLQFNTISLDELGTQDFYNDLIIIHNGTMRHLALPDYGQVTLKIHQEEVKNVIIEKQIKLQGE